MIDITTVTQVNAHWIFTKNGERFKSTAENVRDVWEQAKIKHMMYSMVVNDLSPIRDDVLHTMHGHLDKSQNIMYDISQNIMYDISQNIMYDISQNIMYDIWTWSDYKILAQEFLHKLDDIDISIDYLRALSDHYYKIEIQAHNVMRANRW